VHSCYKCLTQDIAIVTKGTLSYWQHGKHTEGRLQEGVCYQLGGLHLGEVSNLVALPCNDKMSL
jgi:hypothetical protein